MTKHQKDQLWRICSLALVLFVFLYIIVSRIGFRQYYSEIRSSQQYVEQLLRENTTLIKENRKFLEANRDYIEKNRQLFQEKK